MTNKVDINNIPDNFVVTYFAKKHNKIITRNGSWFKPNTDTVEQATTYKLHLDALNDSKNKAYFLASDISTIIDKVVYHHNKSVEEKPLILKD